MYVIHFISTVLPFSLYVLALLNYIPTYHSFLSEIMSITGYHILLDMVTEQRYKTIGVASKWYLQQRGVEEQAEVEII